MTKAHAQPLIKGNDLRVFCGGTWLISEPVPDTGDVLAILQKPEVRTLTLGVDGLEEWDSTLTSFVFSLYSKALSHNIEVRISDLPLGVQHLVHLATSSLPSPQTSRGKPLPLLARLGTLFQNLAQEAQKIVDFLGQSVISAYHLVTAGSGFRLRDFISLLHFCGGQALPIVSLISLLVGLILAFVGAVQLQYFGAQIYVADLVGIAMTREMGAMMTGIIMAGRTGAAFAAQLGTMQVNEEIDALHTLGIMPFDFLVVPRILALVIMMPLLCLYADVVGMLGGAIVGLGMLDLAMPLYWSQTMAAITLPYVWLGMIKSCVFGFIVAASGCLRGMQAGRSAQSVGQATTSAVVTSIVGIIVVDGIFAVVCNVLNI